MRRLLVFCLLTCFSAPLLAAPPSGVQANYDVYMGGIRVATMSETFTRTQDHYAIKSVSQAVGLLALFKPETISVNSTGTVNAHGLQPTTYTSTRKLDAHLNARADFDWVNHRLTLHDRAGQRSFPLATGTQDRLSAMYQLMFLPLQDMPLLKFDMTNGNKVDDYSYVITPGQSVTVPLGTFSALYAASPQEKNASRTEIWLATEHDNFPYKMVITDPDGHEFTQVLTSIDFTK
jgi:hypothetical protein